MASLHTFKHDADNLDLFAIDHSVGRGGRNRVDDVQLIQLLINRVIEFKAAEDKQTWRNPRDERLLDPSGRQIENLAVDGVCGRKTIAAILAFQAMLRRTMGDHKAASSMDGVINALADEAAGARPTGEVYRYTVEEAGKTVPRTLHFSKFSDMYLLALESQFSYPLNILEISVEPLKSRLMFSSAGKIRARVTKALGPNT